MQRLEVSGAVRLIYGSLGVKGLRSLTYRTEHVGTYDVQGDRVQEEYTIYTRREGMLTGLVT